MELHRAVSPLRDRRPRQAPREPRQPRRHAREHERPPRTAFEYGRQHLRLARRGWQAILRDLAGRVGPSPSGDGDDASGNRDRIAPAEGPFLRGHERPVIGANVNGQPRLLRDNLDLLEHSGTTWVRAFLDVRRKLAADGAPAEDPDVIGLREAARACEGGLIVSLKWDFSGSEWTDTVATSVPSPGSEGETALLETATEYLAAIDEPVDYVVLGNEPMWETPDADICVEEPPIGEFIRRAKAHLDEHGGHGDPAYLVGAFNQLGDNLAGKFEPFVADQLAMVADDPDVVGVDVHTHYRESSKARGMLAAAREAVGPDGVVMDTEFSPVWRYEPYIDRPLAEIDGAEAFCSAYDVDPQLTVAEYLQNAKERRITREEYGAWMDAMPFYDGGHLAEMYGLFEEFDVAFGGLGFVQGPWMRGEDWTREGWSPFHINFLYQPAVLEGEGPETAHPRYLDDYRTYSG